MLLSLALSAICIYIPCRWSYRHISPPSDTAVKRYLPYLYLVLAIALPLQMFKNYRYYQYAQEHGGYTFLWVDHAALASSVPFFVRAAQLITVPVFLAIFVFERRKKNSSSWLPSCISRPHRSCCCSAPGRPLSCWC